MWLEDYPECCVLHFPCGFHYSCSFLSRLHNYTNVLAFQVFHYSFVTHREHLRPVQLRSQLAQCTGRTFVFWLGSFVFPGKMKWKIAFMPWFSSLTHGGLILCRSHAWASRLLNPWFPGCTGLQIVDTVTEAILPPWNISFTVIALGATISQPLSLFAHLRLLLIVSYTFQQSHLRILISHHKCCLDRTKIG